MALYIVREVRDAATMALAASRCGNFIVHSAPELAENLVPRAIRAIC